MKLHLAHLSPLDLAAPVLFAVALVGLGVLRSRKAKNIEEFLLAGRHLTAPAFVMSIVSAWYGGILGVSEYSYRYGLSNWFVFGLPYYLHAALFAIFLSRKARSSRLSSIPDKLEQTYGAGAARVGALALFFTTMPAAYLLMLGKLLSWMFGWSYPTALLIGTILSTVYVYLGGLRSVTATDTLQFVIMYGGFGVMVVALYGQFGGLEFLRANVPRELFTPLGGQSFQAVFVWYFIASTALIEPLFYERTCAARSEKIVLPGILCCIAFWALFDFMTTTTGLYARALLPSGIDRSLAFPELAARVLPAGLYGLFLIALLATVMSTIDSYSFLAAAALGRDFLWRTFSREKEKTAIYIRLALGVATVFGFLLALASESVVSVWHAFGSIAAPTLLFPTLSAWFGRPFSHALILPAMISAGMIALVWRLSPFWTVDGSYWLGIEPIFIGLGISLVFYFAGRVGRKH